MGTGLAEILPRAWSSSSSPAEPDIGVPSLGSLSSLCPPGMQGQALTGSRNSGAGTRTLPLVGWGGGSHGNRDVGQRGLAEPQQLETPSVLQGRGGCRLQLTPLWPGRGQLRVTGAPPPPTLIYAANNTLPSRCQPVDRSKA